MRILHVVPSYIPAWRYGGPILSVHGLCRALAARGHDVVVATTNVDGDSDSAVPLGEPTQLDGVEVHYFPSRFLRRTYYSPSMRGFIGHRLQEIDIVHTHSVFLWPTSAAAALARNSSKPYVLSPRGMLVRDLIERRRSFLKRAWIWAFERRNVHDAAAIHVTSAIEEQELRGLGLAPKRVITIPNGVDTPASGDASTRGDRARYILFLGRISWKKGIERLVAAMPHLPDMRLLVAGNDEEGYWPKIAQVAGKLSVAPRIEYIGFIQGNAKDELLAGAACLVLPSLSENFGNVVVEAMAAGCPVVVTPEVGAADIVRASKGGVVLPGEPAALGEGLQKLLADEAALRQMGARGREYVRLNYTWDAVASRMEQAYAEIVQQRTSVQTTLDTAKCSTR
jgi:glycosyltransferase involved in cell wall biosynthesis